MFSTQAALAQIARHISIPIFVSNQLKHRLMSTHESQMVNQLSLLFYQI